MVVPPFRGRGFGFAACLDLLTEFGNRGADAVSAGQEPAKLERQLLVDRLGEGDERLRRSGRDGGPHVVDLPGQLFERIHVVAEPLRALAFLADRLLRGGKRRKGATDRAERRDGHDPGIALGSRHAAGGDAHRRDAGREGGPSQPPRRGRLVTLAAIREIFELVFQQVLVDDVEDQTLGGARRRRGARHQAVEILAAQLLGPRPGLHPVARKVSGIELVKARGGVAPDHQPGEAKPPQCTRHGLTERLPMDACSSPSTRISAPMMPVARIARLRCVATRTNSFCLAMARLSLPLVGRGDALHLGASQQRAKLGQLGGKALDIRGGQRKRRLGGRHPMCMRYQRIDASLCRCIHPSRRRAAHGSSG